MSDCPILPARSALARAATQLPDGISIELQVRDVMGIKPEWDHARAWKFLDRHSSLLAVVMLAAGIQVTKSLLEKEQPNDEC